MPIFTVGPERTTRDHAYGTEQLGW